MEDWEKFKGSTGKIIKNNVRKATEEEINQLVSILDSLDTEKERSEFKSEILKLYGIKISGFKGSGGGP